jgi:invasion protein IalB
MPNSVPKLLRAGPLALLLAVFGSDAAALPDGPPAARPPDASFEDWRLDCTPLGCAAATEVRSEARGAPLLLRLRVTPASGLAETPWQLAVETPLPLHLPGGLALEIGGSAGSALAWRTCDPLGCRAEAPLAPDLLAALRGERAGHVTFTLADGVRVRLRFSLMGFSAALEALEAAG